MIAWPFLLLAWQLDLARACLAAWDRAPVLPQLEPEVRAVLSRRERA